MARDWCPLGRGVHSLAAPDWLSAAWAGLLVGGDNASLGGLAAAHLSGWLPEPPRRITVWSHGHPSPWEIDGRRVTFRRGVRGRRGRIPRTLPEETLLDAADECSPDSVLHLMARAFTHRHTTPQRVAELLQRRSRQRHRSEISQACEHGMAGVESILEWRYLTRIEQAHGLPPASRQVWLSGSDRCDVFYEDYGVIVELDGRLGHEESFRDHRRDNRNALQHDALTLRYGSRDIFYVPCPIAEEVAAVLRRRGWRGEFRLCRNCPGRRPSR